MSLREIAVSPCPQTHHLCLFPACTTVHILNAPPLQLYDTLNPYAPVAWFRTAHRRDVDGVEVVEPPTLSLQPEVEHFPEVVLASLLIVEQKYRMASKRSAGRLIAVQEVERV